MKKTDFLKAVEHEVKTLKKLATKEELENLNFEYLHPEFPQSCIYGQMTGECYSKRAKELMDKACIIVTNTGEEGMGTEEFYGKTYSQAKHLINGKNTGQGWKGEPGSMFGSRSYAHLSALEAYICLKGAKTKSIISFLKGETEKLTL